MKPIRSSRGSERLAMAHRDRGFSRREKELAFVAAFVVVVVVSGLGYFFTLGPGRQGGPSGAVLVDLAGDGNKVSKHFFARRGWEIDWESSGSYFSYTIHGDVEFGQVVTQNGAGNGITSPTQTGDFFIEVVAQGPWTIKVIQGD